MKKINIFFILFFMSIVVFAENALIDSLKLKIEKTTGIEKVKAINHLSKAYWNVEPEKTLEYGNKALSLARELDYNRGKAEAIKNIGGGYYYLGDNDTALKYMKESLLIREEIGNKNDIITALNNLGIVYEDLNNYETALDYYLRSLKIEEEIGDKNGIAGSLNNIGMVYENLSNYNKSLEYFLKSLNVYEEIENKYGIATTLGNIGMIFRVLTNYEKALEYHFKSLNIYEEIEDKNGVASSLGRIGNIYDDIGNTNMALEYYKKSLKIEEELGNKFGIAGKLNNIGIIYDDLSKYDDALDYYLQSLKFYEEISDENGIADASNNIGVVYENLKEYDRALEYLHKALEMYKKIGRKKGIAASLNNIGSVFLKLKNYNKALSYFEQGLKIAKEIQIRDLIIEIYEKISNVYSAENNYLKALEYYRLYSSVKDSIFSKERMEIIAGMETTYEVELLLEEQEKEIELLHKDNEIYKLKAEKQKLTVWLLFFGLAIVIIIGFVIFYHYRLNKKATQLLEKLVKERTRDLSETNIRLKKEITERKQLQNQLIRSERLAGIGELSAGIAHEIRNPLGNISSSAQICLTKYKPGKKIKQFLEIIQEDSGKANAKIKGLLDFANPREVSFKLGSIYNVIKKVITSVNARCLEHKIKIINNYKKQLPDILLDTKWLEQAFLNLFLNAINAMPDGGKLTVSGEDDKKSKQLIITIEDTGTGISKSDLSKIFDPFFSTREDGVGLGLSLCHQIIEDHKGKIEIESQINKGTKVIVTFPITE
ncbi:MAG: tetratricopeptide repeat protein [Candidatus Cloacimonetes bacterium]|nr:tetratricopeptide repeat protein [Candidatus Cloacimonadota bacterium]